MFNPNSVRPIGTRKFEEHVIDVMTSHYYEYQIPGNGKPKHLKAGGKWIWKSEPEKDPYDNLVIAVVTLAVLDYVEAYSRRESAKLTGDSRGETLWGSRCIELENEFFHEHDLTEAVFEAVLNNIKNPDVLHDMQVNGLKRYNRFMREMCKGVSELRDEQ